MRRAMRLLVSAVMISVALVAAQAGVASAAATRTEILTCKAGGFTGYMKQERINSSVYLSYKIVKGSNKGGNHANIYFSDGGNNPILNLSNKDNGIQDGKYHRYYGPYGRGFGSTGVQFIFDLADNPDPRCTGSGVGNV